MLLLICIVIYSVCVRLVRLCYQPTQERPHPSTSDRRLSWSALSLLLLAMILGLWQPDALCELLNEIASL